MRTWILSAVLLTAATAYGQPPKSEPPANPATFLGALQREKPPAPGSVDEAVLHALRQHPDIKLAEAKVRLAEAEAEQAKSLVVLRVAAAFAKLEQAKAELAVAEERFEKLKKVADSGSQVELLSARAQYLRVKSAVVDAEVELNTAKGVAPRAAGADPNRFAVEAGLKWLGRMQESGTAPPKAVPAGTTTDKLKGVLDRMVTLKLEDVPLDRAMEAVKAVVAEPTLTIKLPSLGANFLKNPPLVTVKVEKIPLTAAVQLILDEINDPTQMAGVPDNLRGTYEVYVREYGLLIARTQDAPKDAPTLTEFARQVRGEKAAGK